MHSRRMLLFLLRSSTVILCVVFPGRIRPAVRDRVFSMEVIVPPIRIRLYWLPGSVRAKFRADAGSFQLAKLSDQRVKQLFFLKLDRAFHPEDTAVASGEYFSRVQSTMQTIPPVNNTCIA